MAPLFSLKIVTAHGLIYSSILNNTEGNIGLPPSVPKELLCLLTTDFSRNSLDYN